MSPAGSLSDTGAMPRVPALEGAPRSPAHHQGQAQTVPPARWRRLQVRTLLYLGIVAVTVFFSYLALRGVDFGGVGRALAHSNYGWLVPALAAFGLATLARALRWHALFPPERRPPLRAVGNAMLVGYLFNNILPARAGEAARVVTLRQRAGTAPAEAVGTVVVERVFDLLSILLIFFAAQPWLPHVSWFRTAALAGIGLAAALAAVIVVLVVYGDRPVRFLARPLGRLPLLSAERVERASADLVSGLSGLHRPSVAFLGFFWSLAAWLLSSLSAWLVTYAFGLHLGFDAGILCSVAVGLAMVLPAPPASVGVFEAAALLALNAYGISNTGALPYALVLHVVNFVPFVVLGGIALHFNAIHLRRAARTEPLVVGSDGGPAPSGR
jgi:uncharacterized protein (TIRG00374 family)